MIQYELEITQKVPYPDTKNLRNETIFKLKFYAPAIKFNLLKEVLSAVESATSQKGESGIFVVSTSPKRE